MIVADSDSQAVPCQAKKDDQKMLYRRKTGAEDWYTRMGELAERYKACSKIDKEKVNRNLREFDKYLDTLSLDGPFDWVSRLLAVRQIQGLNRLFCTTAWQRTVQAPLDPGW